MSDSPRAQRALLLSMPQNSSAKYWAHSDRFGRGCDEPGSECQPLAEHLANVAALAESLARLAAPENRLLHRLAHASGMLHDYGKYRDCFQRMIATGKGKGDCPHAIYGALTAFNGNGAIQHWMAPATFAIAGHHAGLPSAPKLGGKLVGKQEGSETLRSEARVIWSRAIKDQPGIAELFEEHAPAASLTDADLYTRMLFSCLVDADRLDTAGRPLIQAPLVAASWLEKLNLHLAQLRRNAKGSAVVNQLRAEVQEACRGAADCPEQMFSLSVPTGGGKTLAAVRFALERAALYPDRYRRIVVVIPYLCIIEQNAAIYRSIFGQDAVLEHHSGAVNELKSERKSQHDNPEPYSFFSPQGESDCDPSIPARRIETENWDSPFIVTTSVRFFESLFSRHPSDLRRVHNLARSIIILDEVQTLPTAMLAPILAVMRELSTDWGCTLVMATATKPAFEQPEGKCSARNPRWLPGTVREIVPDPAALHRALRRVSIEWRLDAPLRWEDLADELLVHGQALCVVNLRDHAACVYDLLKVKAQAKGLPPEAIIHLSTRMCAKHRLEELARVRERLRQNLPCILVSTQLVEAGVDIDFPVGYRALGPLDAIFQVAGRVDREGRMTEQAGRPAGQLVVFLTEDGKTPPHSYKTATGFTEAIAKTQDVQPDDLFAMEKFFERYYTETDLGKDMLELRKKLDFEELAEKFEMISSRAKNVFVPYAEGAKGIEQLRTTGFMDVKLLRSLQQYTVGLQPWEFERAKQQVLYEIIPGSDLWACSPAAYHKQKGLLFEQSMVV